MSVISKLATLGAAGGGGPDYFINDLASSYYPVSAFSRSSWNFATIGPDDSIVSFSYNGSSNYILEKRKDTSVVFSKKFTASPAINPKSVKVDASGNIYVCGQTSDATMKGFLSKHDSSGSLLWCKSFASSGTKHYLNDVAIDSSGNIYVVGVTFDDYGYFAKLDSSGNIVAERYASTLGAYGVTAYVDASDNFYMGGHFSSGGYNVGFIVKFNSSLTEQWRRTFYNTGGTAGARGIFVDGSGNVYVVGELGGSFGTCIILKYDSAGTLQWNNKYSAITSEAIFTGIDADSSGNLYVSGNYRLSGFNGRYAVVLSFDSSGTLLWRNKFKSSRSTNSTYGETFNTIKVDSKDRLVLSGNEENYSIYLTRFPADGSLTGTYDVFTYAADTTLAVYGSLFTAGMPTAFSNTGATIASVTVTESANTPSDTVIIME